MVAARPLSVRRRFVQVAVGQSFSISEDTLTALRIWQQSAGVRFRMLCMCTKPCPACVLCLLPRKLGIFICGKGVRERVRKYG